MDVHRLPTAPSRTRLLRLIAAAAVSLVVALIAAVTLTWGAAQGGQSPPGTATQNLEIEGKVREIAEMLRAPCCPNFNVAQHDSPSTVKMKREIREMLQAGMGKRAIISKLKEEYGEAIAPGLIPALWKPYVFWGGPILGLLALVLVGRWMMSHEKSLTVLHVDESGKPSATGVKAA